MANRWFEHMKRTRRCNSRGAALVEFAIVVIPLLLILFGITEFGFMYKDSLNISNSTRAGARTGASEPGASSFYADIKNAVTTSGSATFQVGDTLCIYQVDIVTNPSGSTDDLCTGGRLYTWNGTDFAGSGGVNFLDTGFWSSINRDSCLGSASQQSVGVALKVTHHSVTGLFSNFANFPLREHTVMRLEPPVNDSAC